MTKPRAFVEKLYGGRWLATLTGRWRLYLLVAALACVSVFHFVFLDRRQDDAAAAPMITSRSTTSKCERVVAEADEAWQTWTVIQTLAVPMSIEGMFEYPIIDERWVGPFTGQFTKDPRPSTILLDFGFQSTLTSSGYLLRNSPALSAAYVLRIGGRDRALRPIRISNVPARDYSKIQNLILPDIGEEFNGEVLTLDVLERVRFFQSITRPIDKLAAMGIDGAAHHAVRVAKAFDLPLVLLLNIGTPPETSDVTMREKLECYMQSNIESLPEKTLLKLSIYEPEFSWDKQVELNTLIDVFGRRGIKMLLAFGERDYGDVLGFRGVGGGVGGLHPLDPVRYPSYEQSITTSNVGCVYLFLGVDNRSSVSEVCERYLQPHHWRLDRAN